VNNEDLCNLYSSPIRVITSRKLKWTGNVTCTREIRNTRKILVGEPEEKISLGRTGRGWKDNIKIIFKESF
jgi:hypothetical protein